MSWFGVPIICVCWCLCALMLGCTGRSSFLLNMDIGNECEWIFRLNNTSTNHLLIEWYIIAGKSLVVNRSSWDHLVTVNKVYTRFSSLLRIPINTIDNLSLFRALFISNMIRSRSWQWILMIWSPYIIYDVCLGVYYQIISIFLLLDSLPNQGDGIKYAKACASFLYYTCIRHYVVPVKNCGSFNVYCLYPVRNEYDRFCIGDFTCNYMFHCKVC